MPDSVDVNVENGGSVDVPSRTEAVSVGDSTMEVSVEAESYSAEASQVSERVSAQETGRVFSRDYRDLENKPSIEGNVLVNDKTFEDLGLRKLTNQDIKDIVGRNRRNARP